LTGTRAPRRFQLVFQPRVLALQPGALALNACTLGFRPFELLPQSRIVSSELFDLGISSAPAHAPVMPEFAPKYKSDPVTKYLPTSG
jgi:hypothetical protein